MSCPLGMTCLGTSPKTPSWARPDSAQAKNIKLGLVTNHAVPNLDQGWPLRGPRAACGPQHLFKEKINRLFQKILREFARQYFD